MIRLTKVVFCFTAALAMTALTATIGAAAANPYQSAEAPQAPAAQAHPLPNPSIKGRGSSCRMSCVSGGVEECAGFSYSFSCR